MLADLEKLPLQQEVIEAQEELILDLELRVNTATQAAHRALDIADDSVKLNEQLVEASKRKFWESPVLWGVVGVMVGGGLVGFGVWAANQDGRP